MNEEQLQQDGETQETVEVPQSEGLDNNQGSDLAPDTGDNQEQKVEFNEQQQQVLNDLAAKKTHKIREAERKAEDLQRQLEETRAKLPQEERPTIPDYPDSFDDAFEDKLAERDEALRNAAAFDARQEALKQQQELKQQQAQLEQQQTLQQTVQGYSERAVKLGVSESELQMAGQAVANFGISDDVTHFILGDEQGPLITTYLAKNPNELDSLRGMNPMQAAVHIATNVKTKATAAKGTSKAPPPADTLGNGGAPQSKDKWLEGGKFA